MNAIKKTISIFCILFLSFFPSTPFAFAQMPVAPSGIAPIPAGLEAIGVVAAAKGRVEIITPGQVGHVAQSGQKVFLNDEIKTDSEGHLQVLLLDETVFTIGPNSSIVIDEFVYDPKTQDGVMQASITKGVFRYVSGRIAAKKPESVEIKFPTATMGIRGTIVAGQVASDGSTLAALLGPGSKNDAHAKIGSFIMQGTGNNSGQNQTVNHPGFGVTVGTNGNISGAFQLSSTQVNNLTTGLLPSAGPRPPRNQGPGQSGAQPPAGQPGQPGMPPPPSGTLPPPPGGTLLGDKMAVGAISGEKMLLTKDMGLMVNTLNNLSSDMTQQTVLVAQDTSDSLFVADGITKLTDLAKLVTGVFHYEVHGGFGVEGSLYAQWNINFGERTICGGDSYVDVHDGAMSDRANLSQPVSFDAMQSDGFHLMNVAGTEGGTFTHIDIKLINSGGVIANEGSIHVEYTDGESVAGGGGTGPRLPLSGVSD